MTRPKRLTTAGLLAVLLAFGIPAAAFAETDVVLYNESQDSNVQTGESSFSNSTANESKSASFDPPAEGETVTSTQTVSGAAPAAPSQVTGQLKSIAPKAQSAAAPVQTEVASATSKAVDALFVGLSVGSSVGP